MQLIKKAPAIATLAIGRQLRPLQSMSDQADMKALIDELSNPTPSSNLHACSADRRRRRAGLTNVDNS
jgi:hypothetical protein